MLAKRPAEISPSNLQIAVVLVGSAAYLTIEGISSVTSMPGCDEEDDAMAHASPRPSSFLATGSPDDV
jgi:hypothetical protein